MPTAKKPTTTNGSNHKRWNFKEFLSGFLIPRCVALRKELPPGARLLWAVIRAFSRRDGFCDAAETTMANRLGVSTRQVRRYLHKLEADGWLETELRVGSTARRYLLLHPLFGGAIHATPDTSGQGSGHKRPEGRTDVSTTVKESRKHSESGVFETFNPVDVTKKRANRMQSANELLKQLQPNLERTFPQNGKTPRPAIAKAADLTQVAAIRREVECWKFELTPELLEKLMRKAAFYGVNGFQVAAAINKANRVAERKPSARPAGPGWFPTVVENHFKEHFTPPARQNAGTSRPASRTHQ